MSALVLPTAMTTRVDREEDLASLRLLRMPVCRRPRYCFCNGRRGRSAMQNRKRRPLWWGDRVPARSRRGVPCANAGQGWWRGGIDPRRLVHAMHPEDGAVVTAVCCGEYGTQYEQTGQRESPESEVFSKSPQCAFRAP